MCDVIISAFRPLLETALVVASESCYGKLLENASARQILKILNGILVYHPLFRG